ncbi:uncharacterized protein [Cherax quadricarinatus]
MPPCTTDSDTMTLTDGCHLTDELSKCINSDNLTEQLKSTRKLRLLVSSQSCSSTVQKIIESGALKRLVNFLQAEDWQLQHEAAWVLCNIAASMSTHTQAVVNAGGVGSLAALMKHSTHQELCHTTAWALSNIAADSSAGRDLILSFDILTPLIRMVNESENQVLTTATWFLLNLCLPQHLPVNLGQMVRCLPTICDLIFHKDAQVEEDACMALTNLATTYKHQLQAVLCPEFYSKLVQFHKLNPGKSKVNKLVNVLQELQPATDINNQVIGAVSVSPERGTSTLSTPRKTPLAKTIKRSNMKRCISPSSWDVATRSTPKRCRDASRDVRNDAPLKRVIRTRASARLLMFRTPGQSTSSSVKKTEIFRAVEMGELERVEELVCETGPAVRRQQTGWSLLHAAADSNQPEVLSFLLKLISPNIVNKEGQTPAHLAALKGHTQVLDILLHEEDLNLDKRDNHNRTFKDLLAAPLFEAVLWWDTRKVQQLLQLGADPDYHAGHLVQGTLTRELQVTTPRQLALSLHREHIFPMVPQNDRLQVTSFSFSNVDSLALSFGDLSKDACKNQRSGGSRVKTLGPDIYRMDTDPRGYVCILSYSSFKERPDLALEGSHLNVKNLSNIWEKMGYTGHSHCSLTAQETKQVLTSVRNMELLDRVGCAVFIISSHGVENEKFLTSDMNLLTTQWVCEIFKDSECPQLKNKPKLFIFDFCCGYYKENARRDNTVKYTRMEEPLQDIMCLYSSSGGFTSYSFTKEGTPFNTALCRTLAQHSHDKELADLYRQLLKECANNSYTGSPLLKNIGFSKKFFFNPAS